MMSLVLYLSYAIFFRQSFILLPIAEINCVKEGQTQKAKRQASSMNNTSKQQHEQKTESRQAHKQPYQNTKQRGKQGANTTQDTHTQAF